MWNTDVQSKINLFHFSLSTHNQRIHIYFTVCSCRQRLMWPLEGNLNPLLSRPYLCNWTSYIFSHPLTLPLKDADLSFCLSLRACMLAWCGQRSITVNACCFFCFVFLLGRFNLKITPIGLFTIQIEAGCVNSHFRLKMDCKNLFSLQLLHTQTYVRAHNIKPVFAHHLSRYISSSLFL